MSGKPARQTRTRHRGVRLAVVLGATLLGGAILLIAALTAGLPLPVVSERYPAATALIDRTPLQHLALCRCTADDEVMIEREDGLRLSAGVYRPEQPSGHAVLLVHGNTVQGRRAPLFRVLAESLRDEGYLVLALDLAGYGRSGDPLELGTTAALDKQLDLDAGLRHLRARIQPSPSTIHIVGHSRGGAPAMVAAAKHAAVRTVVAIGPSRRTWQRLQDPRDLEMFWRREEERRQALFGRDMPEWYDAAAFAELRRGEVIEPIRTQYASTGHPPVLFIDSEREPAEDLEFLEAYVESLAPPARLVRVPDADHYVNTAGALGFQVFDRRSVNTVVDAILAWTREFGGD